MEQSLFSGELVSTKRILYTPSAFARTNLLHLQEAGTLKAQREHECKREKLSSYLFFIVKEGSGTLVYRNHAYRLNTGDCVFIDCQNSYSHNTSEHFLWQLCWTHFYGPCMDNIYDKYVKRGGKPVFHPSHTESFLHLLNKIYDTATSSEYVRDMMLNELLSSLLTLLMQESWDIDLTGQSSCKRQDLAKIKEYLDDNYTQKLSLIELANLFYINKFYLTRIFKEQYGCSIQHYLQQKRITTAKQLLRFTNQSIESIAVECGVEDENYFSRLFKKIEGVSPGEYRKMW